MESTLLKLARGLADILGYGPVIRIEPEDMAENERGWSGAKVLRQRAYFQDKSSQPMIFKLAGQKERCVMARLTEQAQCAPASYAEDLLSDQPAWMAMEDLGRQRPPAPDDALWLTKTAQALASVHAANMGKGREMPWLPVADEAYWQTVTAQLSLLHFERKMQENSKFEWEFGKYFPRLQDTATQFVHDMTALSHETDFLTLTHGDLQMLDGSHLYNCGGTPRIIDFGFCRYAPFYIDLPGWFSPDSLRLYYDALTARGISLRYSDFEERARAACRYTGFIYLCPAIIAWQDGPTAQTGKRLLQCLKIILDGGFSEQKVQYSDQLFQQLLAWHSSMDYR